MRLRRRQEQAKDPPNATRFGPRANIAERCLGNPLDFHFLRNLGNLEHSVLVELQYFSFKVSLAAEREGKHRNLCTGQWEVRDDLRAM
jgi:hypothetical protein